MNPSGQGRVLSPSTKRTNLVFANLVRPGPVIKVRDSLVVVKVAIPDNIASESLGSEGCKKDGDGGRLHGN